MKRTPLAIIFLIVFIDLLGFGLIIPILPSYALRGFDASELTVGFLVAAFSVMQLLFTPLWGRLSDRIGRRPVLAIGLVTTIAGYVLFGLADSLAMLFISRLLGGIGGANISAAQAYIADVTPPHERARGMGLIGAAFGLGFVFGPFLGGVLSVYGYHVPGFVAAGLSTLALAVTITSLPEPERHPAREAPAGFNRKALVAAFRRPKIGVLLLLFFLVTFGFANIYATFPIIATRQFGYADRQVGYLFAFIGVVGAATQGGLIRFLTRRFRENILFLTGTACMALGLAVIPYTASTGPLLGALAFSAFGSGVVVPASLGFLSRRTDPREQGSVLGVNQSLGALGRALGPICGSYLFQAYGNQWPFIAAGGVMLAVFILAAKWL